MTHTSCRLSMRTMAALVALAGWGPAHAQSPELALREFASGQVKKGVRSIGFGGDGATWGNYGLVYKDAGTALLDGGDTLFTNGNDFRFTAVGFTTPSLWDDLAIYIIAMSQNGNDIHLKVKSPGFGMDPVPVTGSGANQAVFVKAAMPLGYGISAGLLLSYEVSQFTAGTDAPAAESVRYETQWRPSGGFGVTWQPDPRVLVGFRTLLNTDRELRTDPSGESAGMARTREYRLGLSVSPWEGALIDVGRTRLDRQNTLNGTATTNYAPNLGFAEAFRDRKLVLRFGLEYSSVGGGFSAKI